MRHRIGRRGAALACLSLYDFFFGLFLATGGNIPHEPIFGETAWGWTWIGVSLFLCLGVFARRDAVFYAAAILIKIVWGLEYFRLDYIEHVPGDWIRGCYWLALCGLVIVIAGWPEPTRLIHTTPPQPGPPPDSKAETRARQA